MPDMEKTSVIDFEAEAKKLRKHFEFTEADLMANQSGVLSEKQMKRIAKEEQGGKKLGWIIGTTLLVGSLAFTPLVFFWFSNLDKMKDIASLGRIRFDLWIDRPADGRGRNLPDH